MQYEHQQHHPQIKQLEWEYTPFEGGGEWDAVPIPGILKYSILKYEGDKVSGLYINIDCEREEEDLDVAKARAQANFEKRLVRASYSLLVRLSLLAYVQKPDAVT